MAPKAEKKPAQPAKKAVAKKSSAGRKKGSKKAVESYKIYIYKVLWPVARCCHFGQVTTPVCSPTPSQFANVVWRVSADNQA